jgi:hypothetical protein
VIETLTTGWLIPSDTSSWWTTSVRGYQPSSSQCFYHWVDTSAGGLLVSEGINHPVVNVSITGLIPLLPSDRNIDSWMVDTLGH